VEHSCNRAGYVVCNDLSVALTIIKGETGGLTPMRPIQKMRELLVFTSGQDYFKLREVVGLNVQ